MASINNQETLPLNTFEKFGLALLAGLLIFLVVLSLRVNVHYYDSYEYINNSRQLVGIQTRYDIPRPPCFSLVLFPFAWLAKVLDSKAIIERSPYFIMTTAGFGCVLIFWQMLRRLIAREFAMLATLLLAFNAMFLHYWIFLMPEVFACFLIMVYWQAVLKERYLIAAIALGLIFNLRYQLLPLGVLGVLYAVLTIKNNDKNKWLNLLKNWTFVALISLVILLGLHYWVIVWGAKIDFSGGMKYLSSWLDSLYLGVSKSKDRGNYIDSVAIELGHLFYHVTGPILAISLIGMLKTIYRREKLDWVFLLWFWGIYLTLSLILVPTRKEPRYYTVILPPIYYFFATGIEIVWLFLTKRLQEANKVLRVSLLIIFSLALFSPVLIKAQGEIIRLCDSSYTKRTGHDIANIIKPNLDDKKAVFWIGDYYTIVPENYLFHPSEQYFFFNLFSNALSFYFDRLCLFNYTEEFIYQGAIGSYAVVNKSDCMDCFENTFSPPKPLTIHKIERQTKYFLSGKPLTKIEGNSTTSFAIFKSESGQEIYLTENTNSLFIDNQLDQPNAIVQFIYIGERLPFYPEPSLFGLPHQAPTTARRKLANIDFILVTELSPTLGEVR